MTNLAEKPERSEDVNRLLAQMKQWQQRLGDTLPLSVENPKPKEINLTGSSRVLDRWQPKWIRDKYFSGRDAPEAVPANNKKRNGKK